jgi:hypothetical protein
MRIKNIMKERQPNKPFETNLLAHFSTTLNYFEGAKVNQKPLAHHPLEAYYDSIVDEPSTLS